MPTIVIKIGPHFFDELDPDGLLEEMAEAADKHRRDTVKSYLRYRYARGERGTWPQKGTS